MMTASKAYAMKYERCWLIQALLLGDMMIRAFWIGAKESAKAVSAALLDRNNQCKEIILRDCSPDLLRLMNSGNNRIISRPIRDNYILGGIVNEAVSWVVMGQSREAIHAQLFHRLRKNVEFPLLEGWMPRIFDNLLDKNMLLPLTVLGLDAEAYLLSPLTQQQLEEILLPDLTWFRRMAESASMN